MSRRVRLGAACIALLILAAPSAVSAGSRNTAGPPADYTKIAGLSQRAYSDEVTESVMLPMHDGYNVYVEIIRPKARGRFPVIAEISPYHGTLYDRDGARMLPEQGGLVNYFVPRGYAVVMMDLRGTGKSSGCLDHLGRNDQSDVKRVIEWVASRPWSNGRIGAIGHSYPGATAAMALAQHPKGLATVVVSAGLGSMYHHQFQAGVPYLLQWAGPMFAYEELALERHLPGGDYFGNEPHLAACGATQSSLVSGEAQLSGQYADWHAERDFRKQAAAARAPVFLIHGVNDNAARIPSVDWFLARNGRVATDKVWIGQWDHGSGCCPNRRGYQWTRALHAWFDRQLMGRDVDTGPPVELFLSDSTFEEATTGARTEIFTARAFPGSPRMLTLYPDVAGSDLSTERPFDDGAVSFAGDPLGPFSPDMTGRVSFRTRPLGRDMLLAGLPKLRLAASVTMPRVHLIANVLDESPDGNLRRISQFAINPELREGLATPEPITPGERYVMHPPGFAMAHHLRKGHRLVLRVTTSDPDKAPVFAVDPNVTIYTGASNTALQVPVVDSPVVYRDKLNLKEPD